jgi:hypothetical protein
MLIDRIDILVTMKGSRMLLLAALGLLQLNSALAVTFDPCSAVEPVKLVRCGFLLIFMSPYVGCG